MGSQDLDITPQTRFKTVLIARCTRGPHLGTYLIIITFVNLFPACKNLITSRLDVIFPNIRWLVKMIVKVLYTFGQDRCRLWTLDIFTYRPVAKGPSTSDSYRVYGRAVMCSYVT